MKVYGNENLTKESFYHENFHIYGKYVIGVGYTHAAANWKIEIDLFGFVIDAPHYHKQIFTCFIPAEVA